MSNDATILGTAHITVTVTTNIHDCLNVFFYFFIMIQPLPYIRPFKTEPPCESHSVELIFAQCFEKALALCLVCDILLAGSFMSCVRMLLVQKNTFFWA